MTGGRDSAKWPAYSASDLVDAARVSAFARQRTHRSDKLSRSDAKQRFVTRSPLRTAEKVASRSGSGRQARRASRARALSDSRR